MQDGQVIHVFSLINSTWTYYIVHTALVNYWALLFSLIWSQEYIEYKTWEKSQKTADWERVIHEQYLFCSGTHCLSYIACLSLIRIPFFALFHAVAWTPFFVLLFSWYRADRIRYLSIPQQSTSIPNIASNRVQSTWTSSIYLEGAQSSFQFRLPPQVCVFLLQMNQSHQSPTVLCLEQISSLSFFHDSCVGCHRSLSLSTLRVFVVHRLTFSTGS